MATSIETLVFELIGRDKSASRAFNDLRRSVDGSTGSVDKNTQSLQKNQQAQKSAIGAAAGLGIAFSAMSSPIAAAGAGAVAFGAVAVPSIKKVATALSGPGGLAASWGTLDNRQRNMALGIQTLGHRFSGLSKAMEPRVAQTFGTALGIVNRDLGPFGQLAQNAGGALEGFLTQFSQQAGLTRFISFLSREAGPAISLLGTDITNISHAVFALLQSWGGLGLAELKLVTGVLTGITGSLTWLSEHAPGITSAAVAIGGVALALSKLGLLSGVLKLTGIAAISGQMAGFAAATRGATLAEKGLLATTTALDAITPLGWVILGTAALGSLIYATRNYRDGTQQLISTMAKQDKASGLNVAGYQKLADALQATTTRIDDQQKAGIILSSQTAHLTAEQAALAAGHAQAAEKARNLTSSFGDLAQKYGITSGQAQSLIVHAGAVNDILKTGGKITPEAARKINDYANANRRAQNPTTVLARDMGDFANKTLLAKDRTKALSDALNQFFNPALTADQSLITLKNDAVSLAKALDASGGKTGFLTQKQRDARGAFDTYIGDVASAASSAFDATGKTSSYNKVIRDALPLLYHAAGNNRALRHEIDLLKQTLKGGINEKVTGTGSWTILPTGKHITAAAAGMRVPGYGGGDRWPALLEGGESVVPKHLTPAVAPFLKAAGVPGFAAGVVGRYGPGTVAGLVPWTATMNNKTLHALESAVASAVVSGIRATGFGGFGGGGPGGPVEALMRMMAAARGWTGTQWAALNAVEMREAGYNLTAQNPTSGAYGLAQFINGPREYFQWGGSPFTAAGQITGMLNYIASRYIVPTGAWAHEQQFGWYGKGLKNGLFTRPTLIGVGDRGPELVNITPAGRRGGGKIVLEIRSSHAPVDEFLAAMIRKYVRIAGGGDVQAAFGGG